MRFFNIWDKPQAKKKIFEKKRNKINIVRVILNAPPMIFPPLFSFLSEIDHNMVCSISNLLSTF